MSSDPPNLTVGTRVEVVGKGIRGKVAYIGTTEFASGKWVGVELDEPKGKNNGSVQGKSYFKCADEHGIFVRQSQLAVIDAGGGGETGSSPSVTVSKPSPKNLSPATSNLSPDDNRGGKPKSRLRKNEMCLDGLPINASKIPPPPPVMLTSFATANYRSASIANINESPKLSETVNSVHSYSTNGLDADGFVKPQPKSLMNYFKASSLIGSKKELGKTNSAPPPEKPNKSPLKWLSSFSPKKTIPISLDSSENLTDNRKTTGGSDPCLSPLDSTSRRWTFGASPVYRQASSEDLSNGKCISASGSSCLKARKAISCNDGLSEVHENDDDDDADINNGFANGEPTPVKTTTESDDNEWKDGKILEKMMAPESPLSLPTHPKANGSLRRHSLTTTTDQKLSMNLKKLGNSALLSAKGVVGLKKRRSSMSHGIPIEENKVWTTPPRGAHSSSSTSTVQALPTRNPSSRLSLPASTQRNRLSVSPRTRVATATPKKPPRLSLTASREKRDLRRQSDILPSTAFKPNSLPPRSPVVAHRSVSTLRKSFTPRTASAAPFNSSSVGYLASIASTSGTSAQANPGSRLSFRKSFRPEELTSYHNNRLPVAGSRGDPKDSKSLQSTPSGSRSNLSTTGSAKFDLGSKRASFVETGFASDREIIPTYTPGTPASVISTPISTPVVGLSGEERFSAVQALEALRNENKDLSEKLETLKAKRSVDLEKLRELDRLRLEVETLSEFRAKVLESQAALQRDLKKAKNDAREAIESKERHAEEMAELSEAVEMATLDKEMAEEKAETLQLELEQANEKVEQLETELRTLKEEMSGKVSLDSGEVTAIHVKQFQAENARLREALLKLRDSSAHEKHLHQKTLKEVETLRTEVKELTRTKERLETRLEELEAQVTDLQERNDAALGAEEMVENLTVKNLNLEEKVAQLTEAVADLEALQDVNDQLQESAKELEMELRDDLQQAIITNQNIIRDRDALLETIADYNATIVKFRDLVQKLTDENELLRKNLEEESSKSIPGLAEALDFKKMFAETKAQTTAIDLELRRLEAKEAATHVQYLSAFMPEGFMKRGGDNDAILVLLLIPRLMCKAELLLGQVREKLMPVSITVEGVASTESSAISPEVERFAFSSQLCFLLYTLLSELHRWISALNVCSSETFLKVGILISELSIQERAVDFYLELLRKSQLDENIPTDGLEKCIISFQNFYTVNLSEEPMEPGTMVSDLCLASAAASDCIVIDVSRLLAMLKKTEKDSNVTALLQDIKTIGESLRQLAKRTRRYLPDPPKQPPVSSKLQSQLLNDSVTLTKVVKILQETCKQAVRHAGMLTGNEGIPSSKLEEFLQAAMDKCDSHVEGAGGIKEVIKEWLTTSLMTMTDLAQVVNEAPVAPKEKPPAPLSIRAQTVKAELDQTRNLRIQLEDKEASIKELRKVLRAKQDELSEATIRKELAEKKLSNATKDNEMSVEKLTRKLEDVQSMLQRKEREFQATLEHFQSDIESLESERGELKEKLMSVSKIRLLEGLSRSPASTPLQSPIHGVQTSVQQVSSTTGIGAGGPASDGLIEYTRHLQRELWRSRSQKVVENLKKLPPLDLPKKSDDKVKQLAEELAELRTEWTRNICDSLKISFNPSLNAARKEFLLNEKQRQKLDLAKKMAELKHKIGLVQASRKADGVKKADFATFASDRQSKDAVNELRKIGAIKFPGWENNKQEPQKIILSADQLQRIHQLLSPLA